MHVRTLGFLTAALVSTATVALAGSFTPASLVPDAGIDVLDRAVARDQLQRELFGDPHASVVIGHVDVYDRFPYLESHSFQVVSDPAWNRLLFGESGKGLDAFDGANSSVGALASPHGLAADEFGRLYVADTGNDRIVVFATSSEFDELSITPLYTVDDLARPYDVAFSDAGTPFDASDDRIYVAETGANRVARVDLSQDSGRVSARLGKLGTGEGRFAGPTAIAVGRTEGRNNDLVYVADSHAQRIVQLRDAGGSLLWEHELSHDLPEVSALDTDHFGNLYAASPRGGEVRKFAPDLLPVASLREGVERPRSFHVPMFTVRDHTKGTVTRSGHGSGVVVEHWDDDSGLRMMDLGVDVADVALSDDAVMFTLTDHARVTARVVDDRTGHTLRQIDLGEMDAGRRQGDLASLTAGLEAGDARVQIEATSTYSDDRTSSNEVALRLSGEDTPRATVAAVLGASPNPFNPRTSVEFVVPEGRSLSVSMTIVDARGRVVKTIDEAMFAPGRHGLEWNGTDDAGQAVGSGVYLFRLSLDGTEHAGKLALVK